MFIIHKNKIIATLGILGILAFGTSSFRQAPMAKPNPGQMKMKFVNLKVLPKNIDPKSLKMIMHEFCSALGYKCGNCHAWSKTNEGKLDFASDAKKEKLRAREMMKMVVKLNKKFFKINGNLVTSKYDVTCYTCHHGNEHPLRASVN